MHICSHEDGAAMPVGGGALIEAGDANQRRGTLSHNARTAADGVDCEHKGLLPLWFKPWVFCRYGLSPFVFTIKREGAMNDKCRQISIEIGRQPLRLRSSRQPEELWRI